MLLASTPFAHGYRFEINCPYPWHTKGSVKMKLRQRIDELGLQLAKLTDTLRFTQTEKHGYALDYRLRLELFEVAKNLKELGYQYEAPAELSLDALIKRECKASAQGRGVDAPDIVNRVHNCLANHSPALRELRSASGATDTLDVRSWDFLTAQVEEYLFAPSTNDL